MKTLTMHVNAVVLAGADNDGGLASASSEKYEALVDINGRPMLYYVLRGISQAKTVDKVAIVGPVEDLNPVVLKMGPGPRVSLVERGTCLFSTLMAGIKALPQDKKVLIVTSDIPFITGEAIDDFVGKCHEHPASVHYSIVRKESNEARFPGVKRTYVNLKDGVFTGGNLFLVDPEVVVNNEKAISDAFALRKKPLSLLMLLGPQTVFKFALGMLSVADVEQKVEKILGLKGKAIVSSYPEIGVDVDKPSDLELARSALSG